MAGYDDPVFVKALKFLHSPAKDSSLQIMHLLEEVMEQKYGGSKSLNLKFHIMSEDPSTSLDVPRARGSRGASPALPGHSEKSSRSSTPPSEPVSSRTSPDRDDEDLALQIFEEDLFCTVCKGMRVTSDNRLLECNDCHVLYHQDCHKPPVDSESSDPRLVWTCGDCIKKSQEKQPKSKSSDSSKSKLSSDSHTDSSSRKHKTDSDGSASAEPPTKKHKTDSEKGHKKNDKTDKSDKGHHNSKSHGSKSSSTLSESKSKSSSSNLNFNKAPGSPTGKTPSCTANIIAADRRLQNMKKKAAAKMQEKRSNPK